MDALIRRCAGVDVHKRSIMVCVRVLGVDGGVERFVEEFRTMTRDLLAMSDWLLEKGVTDVAMESTGVYWKPIYNILEGTFKVMLCNAQHIENVPGRKTDVKDCEWIAQLLQHGLLSASFVPPRPRRDLRELTRERTDLTTQRGSEVQRIEKVLEDANVKLAAVATDILGKSGRDMIEALIAAEGDAKKMANLARGRMRGKIPELQAALEGHVTDHHRFLLKMHYEHIQYVERMMERLTERIEQVLASEELDRPKPTPTLRAEGDPAAPENNPLAFDQAIAIADEIPGIDVLAAQTLLSEIGTDMRAFRSEKHIASWVSISPANHESAGKRKNVKTGKGNRWLKRILVQVAWAAIRTKGTYFSAQFARIAKRRGKKRAALAVAHSILTVLYYMLKYHRHYQELGADYFDRLDPERVTRYHVGRLEDLGWDVTLAKPPVAA